MAELPQEWHCLKCGRPLEQAGVVTFQGRSCPVFQCDECLVEAEMFGEKVEVAYTFAVDAAGHPFDPAANDDEPFIP